MAAKVLKDLTPFRALKTGRLTKFSGEMVFIRYDALVDAFYLMVEPPTVETVVYHVDDSIGLLFEPSTHEVVGFQIEAFQHVFVEHHAALKRTLSTKKSANVLTEMSEKKALIVREVVAACAQVLKQRRITISKELKYTPSHNIAYA